VFSVGINSSQQAYPWSNFTLRDLTIESRPLWAVTNITDVTYNTNPLTTYKGAATYFAGSAPYSWTYNILITNCQFLYGNYPILILATGVSNVLVRSCQFNMWGGSNTGFGNVAFFGQGINFVVIENTFNGNANIPLTDLAATNFSAVSTNPYYNTWGSPSGFVFFQEGGNFCVARNTILNNSLEGVQINAGPSAVVGNTFQTVISDGSCCALALGGDPSGVSSEVNAISTCFIGNSVYGGRTGVEPQGTTFAYTLNCSGNSFTLYPPFDIAGGGDGVASVVYVNGCLAANVCGNTLSNGGLGFKFSGANGNALILNNNFGAATFGGIGYTTPGDFLNTAQIFGNSFNDGVTFHVQLTFSSSFGWFIEGNTNLNSASNSVPLFTDPLSSAAHISN
jgi:hypothetical protein